jgi:hypothetical protein
MEQGVAMARFQNSVVITTGGQQTILLDAALGDAFLGGNGVGGSLALLDSQGEKIVTFTSENADLRLGTRGQDGDILLFPSEATNINSAGQATVRLDGQSADLRLGGRGKNGEIWVFPTGATDITDNGQATIRLNGEAGDIELLNADAAESFEVMGDRPLEPGDVMVLDDDGLLAISHRPYDRRVAGVVAGASGRRPGIVFGRDPTRPRQVPIALMGRAYCKAEAADQPIAVGDLLTTSPAAAHAMRVTDHARAFGAVLGKAMGRLETGRGLVPVLVALQ